MLRTMNIRNKFQAFFSVLILTLFTSTLLEAAEDKFDIYIPGSRGGKPGYLKNKNWVPLPGEGMATTVHVDGKDVYVSGNNEGYWKNSVWVDLTEHGMVRSITSSHEAIYFLAKEGYWSLSKNNGELKWIKLKNNFANSIFASGKDVYLAGYINDSNSNEFPAFWIGNKITNLPMDKKWEDIYFTFIQTSGKNIYVAASLQRGCGEEVDFGYWENAKWISIPHDIDKSLDQYTTALDSAINGLGINKIDEELIFAMLISEYKDDGSKTTKVSIIRNGKYKILFQIPNSDFEEDYLHTRIFIAKSVK